MYREMGMPVLLMLIFTCRFINETATTKSIEFSGNRIYVKQPSVSAEVVLHDTIKANEFFTKALMGTMIDVELGRSAQSNSEDEAVRLFGQALEQDHSMLQRQLVAIGREEEFAVSQNLNAEVARQIEQLRQRKGKSFDSIFLQMIVSDHSRDLVEYRTASSSNQSAKLKQFATDGIPVLEKHLAKAQELIQRKEYK